jgi:hypothetical protein
LHKGVLQLARQDVHGQLAEEALEEAGDGVRIIVVARAEQIDIALGVELLLELPNDI